MPGTGPDRRMPTARTRIAAWLAALHLVGLAAIPAAESLVETRASMPAVHLDASGGPACPPAHDHDHCLFCRHLGGSVVLLAAATPLPWPIPTTMPAAGAFLVARRLDLRALRRARAPPERSTTHRSRLLA